MSIRSELRANWQAKYGKPMTSRERICYMDAKEMIEEFLIPHFREMAQQCPSKQNFSVSFIFDANGIYYFSTIRSFENRKVSPYSEPVILQAMNLAKDYAIDAKSEDFGLGVIYKFEVDIS